ncbi:MAG TPA: hypothetical protein VIW03_10115, partial [Anaeromyxobacter sp.]
MADMASVKLETRGSGVAAARRARFLAYTEGFLALALAAALSSSSGCKEQGAEVGAHGGGTPQPRDPPSTAPGPLTAEALAPVIRERALPGELPDRIVIELARDAAPGGRIGKASPATVLAIAPATRGVVVWESPSTLSFTPAQPFEYATRYQVALEKVETRDGVVAGAPAWTSSFQTPRFQLVRIGLDRLAGAKAEVAVVFSGAVRPEAVAPFLAWEVDGERQDGVRVTGTERPNVVRAALASR